jgi:hypothetical protein
VRKRCGRCRLRDSTFIGASGFQVSIQEFNGKARMPSIFQKVRSYTSPAAVARRYS